MTVEQRFKNTLLSLAQYAKLMGITPPHLWQGASATVFPDTCKGVWYAHDWQSGKQISRESLAYAIAQAESDIADVLGYWPAPKWISSEMHHYPQFYRRELFGNGRTNQGMNKSIVADWGKFIQAGRRATTLVSDSNAVVYSDPDGDGYNELATITVLNVTDSLCELKVYFEDKEAEQSWEIRPYKTKNISGTTLTITFDAWLLLDPTLQEQYPNTNNPLEPINLTQSGNYVTAVDVYREYTDSTQSSAEFSWRPKPKNTGLILCPSCGGSGCVACSNVIQSGCISIYDVANGIVVPQPATYSDGSWSQVCWTECREPDTVKIWYYAGDLNERYLRGVDCDLLKNNFAQAIAWLATARLDRDVCGCSNVIDLFMDLRRDLAFSEPDGGSFVVSDDVLNNPFGTRKGEVMAWNKIKHLSEIVPDLAIAG